jgi:hypothetical protein
MAVPRALASGFLALSLLICGPAAAAATTPTAPVPFNDVGGDTWAVPAIALLAGEGVVKGVATATFAPDQPVTEEQAVTFLSRLFPASGATPDHALPGVDAWAQAAVAWAEAQGVVDNPSAFAPIAAAPRAQVVAWVVRALGLQSATVPPSTFADAASIPPQYAAAVDVAQADGLVVGDTNGDFLPSSPVTRAQVAVILLRAEEALALDVATPTSAAYAWQDGATALLSGTATTGSDTLPIGAITAGRLTSPGGAFAADFAEAAGIGAGTLVTTSGGQTTRTTFLWQEPTSTAPGGLWLYAGAAAVAYGYTAPQSGTVQVSAASALATTLGAGESLAITSGAASGTESATATVSLGQAAGGATLTLTYAGPTLPTGALIATETAAAAASVAP